MSNETNSSSPISRLRMALDIITTMSVVAIAAVVIWTSLTKAPRAESGSATRPPKTARPEPPLPSTPVSLDGAAINGSNGARVALIIYSDFQCPYCAKFSDEVLPALQEKYVRPGTIQLAFRHFPLPIHPMAQKAAEAAECAGKQNRFWEMHDALFRNPRQLAAEDLRVRATSLRLNLGLFDKCLAGDMSSKVLADAETAKELAIRGTPAFLLGTIQPDGRVKVTRRLSGAQPLATFEAALTTLLKDGAN